MAALYFSRIDMARRKNWEAGNVVEIKLADDSYCYGVVIDFPLIVFGSSSHKEKQKASRKLFSDIGFRIWVMKYAIDEKSWPVIGSIELDSDLEKEPTFYKFNVISKKFSHYRNSVETETGLEQCIDLECAAAWDPEHIESRLIDLKNGTPNKWVESLKAENKV